ncbi:MAG: hypothetical protein A3C13_01680 [Candidatus Lloydbacteria bacterium RIFCSPHIGHO2_02_FULL_50_11]|nr:MAG: hypothetical protein A3C13_01680 [Candidatus Lloydbacteria bacterium RIFCSPHIGHO2_02_FULL_50_11]
MRRNHAQKLAEEMRKTYDNVAGEFSASRTKFWDELAFLAEHTQRDDHVLDIGCGNGRFFPLVREKHAQYVGIDYSEGLIREAKRLHPNGNFIVGDATQLPFPDNTFDIAYSFAVIHHVPSKEPRAQFVCEAARVLRHGSIFVLSVWRLWTPSNFGKLFWEGTKNRAATAIPSLLSYDNKLGMAVKNALDMGDLMLTFGKKKAPRYLHAFTKGELVKLLTKNGFSILSVDSIAHGNKEKNIVVVARKS